MLTSHKPSPILYKYWRKYKYANCTTFLTSFIFFNSSQFRKFLKGIIEEQNIWRGLKVILLYNLLIAKYY